MKDKYTRVKMGCYASNSTMAVVANLSPILFITFRNIYGISFSLLGLLVLVNFCTQLIIDLIFSFFSHKFNLSKTVKLMPFFALIGLGIYALAPIVFPQNVYAGIVIGTIIFSAASGLGEVLISPVIAAIPSENPEREMSKLHSIYAWGSVVVIIVSTLFLKVFSSGSWQILTLVLMMVPLSGCFLFMGTEIPRMETPEKSSGALKMFKNKSLLSCLLIMFLGGAAECTMAQWCSGYAEQALGIDKMWGDIFGAAMFAMMLGTGRTLYAKRGKDIDKTLLICIIGSAICYMMAVISPSPIIGLIACALAGLATSMLWPGNLIATTNRISDGGVFLFAILAAGGDLGASVVPQLVGVITDAAMANPALCAYAAGSGLEIGQLAMKIGMAVATLFPLAAIPFYYQRYKETKVKQ